MIIIYKIRNDYAAQSQQKRDKQIKISKLFKRQLELNNTSTKKGRSVNFSPKSTLVKRLQKVNLPHLRPQHIYYLLMKHPSTPTTHLLPTNEAPI